MIQTFEAPGWELGANVPVRLWSPDGLDDRVPAALLVVHDGTAYARRDLGPGDNNGPNLLGKVEGLMQSGEIAPVRVALLDPVDRHLWYTAHPQYSKALALPVMGEICDRVEAVSPKIAVGSSLGALSMVATEAWHPGTFDGMFLQSTSWHHPDYDKGENRRLNGCYDQGERFIKWFRDAPAAEHMLKISLTCGWEGNWDGNEALDATLEKHHGHRSVLRRVDGGHNMYWWGRALTPHLGGLIRRCMDAPAERLAS